MAAIPVIGYKLAINERGNNAQITLRLKDGTEVALKPDSAAEFAALAAVLNESPVGFFRETGTLLTGWEEVG